MNCFEVEPDELRRTARRGVDFVADLDRSAQHLGDLRLPADGFPLTAGQELVAAYDAWLDGYAESVHLEAVQWDEAMTVLRASGEAYLAADGTAANDYQAPAA